MTSKEILEHYKAFNKITTTHYLTIKKELEKLESLNKEKDKIIVGLLKGKKDYREEYEEIKQELNGAFIVIEKLNKKIEQLKKENEDLRDKLNSEDLNNWQLHCKYGKYKTSIEILKDVLNIGLIEDIQKYDFIYYWLSLDGIAEKELSKGDYELLKEVLE